MAGIAHQKLQKRVLFGGQLNRAAAASHGMLHSIQLQVFYAQHTFRRTRAPFQERSYPCRQFRKSKRLNHEVVCPHIKFARGLCNLAAICKNQYGHRLPRNPQMPQHSHTFFLRQAQIQNGEIVLVVLYQASRLLAVLSKVNGVLLGAKTTLQKYSQSRIVFGHQQSHNHSSERGTTTKKILKGDVNLMKSHKEVKTNRRSTLRFFEEVITMFRRGTQTLLHEVR